MGRSPCCDKVGIKKGPWTPEEDILLVSYVQEHGPGNWRLVPTNTGLQRCSKSCRLRWTNYLRPGIKRGNFTPHEEGMIIHLQALLGNKWAAIASYLPQRTDNDVKNYWNTHLKKKLKKFQPAMELPQMAQACLNKTLATGSSSTIATYASSTEIASPNICSNQSAIILQTQPKDESGGGDLMSNEHFESILWFENMNNVAWEKSTCGSTTSKGGFQDSGNDDQFSVEITQEMKQKTGNNSKFYPSFSSLEKWLLDDSCAGKVEEMNQWMELSPIF
ncbi:hypothetical protein ES319_D13G115400v1 [Gossypium barbadense]|uniref:Uncharacterized protein n=2 Tax=Gossypium TaxID=3633 RepID=A0A5J5NK64_GOSBA|nr:hypothetical protein ES319_D13G115400v1 [Gossypium barbadense]TYG37197.1 hypothetical protein ES288_D13G122400v1 [Gossypium darwinii]